MKIAYLIIGISFLAGLPAMAQTVSPVLINMQQLSASPDSKICTTCPEKERDGGWKGLKDMPIPKGAIIKTQSADNLRPVTPGNQETSNKPQTASPVPNQTFLGQIDQAQSIPPDTHGAIGPNHIVTATNDILRIHTKTGAVLSTVSINAFAGVTNTCDPYIQYDPGSARWFYTAIDCNTQNNNRLVVLVSASNDPTGNWFRYSFVPSLPGGAFFLDHPYLGFDGRWLVVSGRKFPGAVNFMGPVLFLFDKANLIANGTIVFGTNAQAIEKTSTDGDAPLPVTVFGSNPNPGTFYILQNWNSATSTIRLSTITGDIPAASWNTSSAVFPSGGSAYNTSPGEIVEQVGEPRKLSTNDARISSGVMVNGKIWCAHHVGITSTNVAVQWWQLNGAAGTNFGNILQRGRIGDGIDNNYRWFPSIAVNSSEDVIIGYTVSSNTSLVSSAYSFRTSTTPLNTTLDENIYKVGLSTYYKTFGGSKARWGDYSHSAVDPLDESLWTIQEYADQRIGAGDNNSRFGIWWAQVSPQSSLLQRDAGIGVIIDPVGGLICKDVIRPKISIRNIGKDTLKTVEVGMILDGLPVGNTTSFNNLNLPTYALSEALTLSPDFTPSGGAHTLKVYTKNPNGLPDLKLSNDTSIVSFTVAPTLSLPYSESFETAAFPPANGSAVINGNAGSITWAKTSNAGNPGNASIVLNSFNYSNRGERDIYRTSVLNVAILDSVVLNFNVAYKEHTGFADSLVVVYSPDCGSTWLPAGYAKGGSGLSTSPGATTNSFVPTATEWRRETLVLKDFCSKGLTSIMIGFQSYNDFGNNIYLDGIDITGFVSPRRNIILNSIFEPQLALCTNSFTPAVRFTNAGADTIQSLKINYQVDGGNITTLNWTGSLPKCSTVNVTLSNAVAAPGTHVLTVFTSAPNDLNDLVTASDTLQKTFTIFNTTPLSTPVVEGFETPVIPSINWGIQNLDGLKTWERSTTTAKTGSASLLINNGIAKNANKGIDNFVSPIVANSAAFDSLFVQWDYAYKNGSGLPGSSLLPSDSLELLITQNCGQSFTSLWVKSGDGLQTVTNTGSNDTSQFIPRLPGDWKTIRIYLTPYVSSGSFQVYLSAKSNTQNNIWVDNVNISSKTLPVRLKKQGYLIYPNPFRQSFVVHHTMAPADLKELLVYNAAGQLVWDKGFNGNAITEINIDLRNQARGLYILKMIYSDKTIVEKIVKD